MVVNVTGKKRQRAQNTASKHLSLPQLALGFQSDTWSWVHMGRMPLNQSDIQPTRRSSLTYAMCNSKKSFIGKCVCVCRWVHFYKNAKHYNIQNAAFELIICSGGRGVKCSHYFYAKLMLIELSLVTVQRSQGYSKSIHHLPCL